MLRKYLTKKKPRVFLGKLAVAPRTDIKRHLEDWTWQPQSNLGAGLQSSLEQIFTLPLVDDAVRPSKHDFALDVIVQNYQSGDFLSAFAGEYAFPVFWRPKVTVNGRLYYIKSKKVISTYTVKEKFPWSGYVNRMFQPSALFGFEPAFTSQDLEYLLCQACYKMILKIRKENEL